MRARVANLFNWKRVLRVTGGIALAGGTVVTIGTVSLSAASCYSINRIRPRTYTDDYHLNPEILRMPYRNVEFSAEDGLAHLRGWWIPATVHGRESNRIVILMHPYNNHKSNLLGVASSLWYHGYSIFMFDFRSFVSNPKTRQTIGYLEQYDAIAAINYVKHNHYRNNSNDNDLFSNKQIVLMGASMGGACAICASKVFKEDNLISAIVTDCAFSSLRVLCKYRIGIASALWFPTGLLDVVVNIMDAANHFIYGYSIDDVSPVDVVSEDDFDIPLLLLHSECDAVVPFHHSQALYKECKSTIKNLYCIKNGAHCAGYFINPPLFTKYLCQWVDDVLDHEIVERKQRQKEEELAQMNEEEESNYVTINNDFIMFDSNDDIGIDEENDTMDEQTVIGETNVHRDEEIIQEMMGSQASTKMKQVNEANANGSSSMMTYLGSFFKK
eukprot:51426_1